VGEFRLTLAADEAAARRQFQPAKSGSGDPAAFWTTPVHGQRPLDWLKKHALADAVRNKTAERLGEQHHIADVLDYPALLARLRTENQQRAEAVAQHQPVYGPQQFDLTEFYDLWLSDLKMKLIDTLPEASQQQNDKKYAALLDTAVHHAKVVVDQQVYGTVDTRDLDQ
jgi:hypothetical protein